jgi:hypothetical protein
MNKDLVCSSPRAAPVALCSATDQRLRGTRRRPRIVEPERVAAETGAHSRAGPRRQLGRATPSWRATGTRPEMLQTPLSAVGSLSAERGRQSSGPDSALGTVGVRSVVQAPGPFQDCAKLQPFRHLTIPNDTTWLSSELVTPSFASRGSGGSNPLSSTRNCRSTAWLGFLSATQRSLSPRCHSY